MILQEKIKLNLQFFAGEAVNEDHHPVSVGDKFTGDDRSHSEQLNTNGLPIFWNPKYSADKTSLLDHSIKDAILGDFYTKLKGERTTHFDTSMRGMDRYDSTIAVGHSLKYSLTMRLVRQGEFHKSIMHKLRNGLVGTAANVLFGVIYDVKDLKWDNDYDNGNGGWTGTALKCKVLHGPISTTVEDFSGEDEKVIDLPLTIHGKGGPIYWDITAGTDLTQDQLDKLINVYVNMLFHPKDIRGTWVGK